VDARQGLLPWIQEAWPGGRDPRYGAQMTGFALVHGAGDVGWYWHLVEAELRARGHVSVAPDLPADDDNLTLTDYRDVVVEAAAAVSPQPDAWVVVGQSFGAFTAPLVAERLDADALALVAGMIPAVGEAPDDWWEHVGYAEAAAEQATFDGGQTGSADPFVSFYADVPRALAEEALTHERAHPSLAAGSASWPLTAWPRARVTSVVCTQDHFLPPALQRRLARQRLGVEPVEIDAGHCVALSRPVELADVLEGARTPHPPPPSPCPRLTPRGEFSERRPGTAWGLRPGVRHTT
jgi:pimeloyl-ACP methyl ester carboxylesterase